MCAIKPEPSVYSEQTLPPCHELEFYFFILFYLELLLQEGKAAAAGMVFCVSCGKKLAGRYCSQCGEDSQSTADAQSQVSVLTTVMIPSKGSAAGGSSVAQASGQVLKSLPAAVA